MEGMQHQHGGGGAGVEATWKVKGVKNGGHGKTITTVNSMREKQTRARKGSNISATEGK
jgi:hypothetical protein